ncbi:MAG: hypothetical protein ABJA11_06080 [Pseudolysinimonas sp.]
MVYAFTQDVPIDEAGYRRVMESLGSEPLAGLIVHLCVRREDGGLRYIDVWDSEESCTRAFDDRIHSAVDKAFGGSRPDTEPEVHVLDVLDIAGVNVAGSA